MSDAAASARIRLDVDDKNLGPQLSGAESAVSSWAGRVKGAIAAIGLGLLTKQVVDFGRGALSAYNEQVDAEKKLNAVLESTEFAAGRTKEQLVGMAGELQTVTNVADDTIIKAQTLIATFTNIKGDQFDRATRSAIDMGAILGGAEAAAMQLGKALNDPVAGITALTRSGVSFSESQKEAIKVLAETGDMAKAQILILNEVDKEFGGAADAGDNLGDKLASLSTRWGEAQESIGHTVAVAATDAIPTLDRLMTVVEGSTSMVSGLVTVLGETALEFLNVGAAASELADTEGSLDSWAATFKQTIGGIPELLRSIDIGLIELAGTVAKEAGFSDKDIARMKGDAMKRSGADSIDKDVENEFNKRQRDREEREKQAAIAEADRKAKRAKDIAERNKQTEAIMGEGTARAEGIKAKKDADKEAEEIEKAARKREENSRKAAEQEALRLEKERQKAEAEAVKQAEQAKRDARDAEEQKNRDIEERIAEDKARRAKKAADLQRSLGKIGVEDLNDAISSARINNYANAVTAQPTGIGLQDQRAAEKVFAGISARDNVKTLRGRNAVFAPENDTKSPGQVNIDVKQSDVVTAVKNLQAALVAKLGTAVLSK